MIAGTRTETGMDEATMGQVRSVIVVHEMVVARVVWEVRRWGIVN